MRAPLILLSAAVLAVTGGCGGDGEERYELRTPPERVGAPPIATPTPQVPRTVPADPRTRRLIMGWAAAVRRGDERAAARYFAVPALIEQGTTFRLTTRVQVQAFNAGLPCGARVMGVARDGRYVVATFRLVERRGGDCGTGTGNTVRVAFLIEGGKFREFHQLPDARPAPTRTPTPEPAIVA